jgi:hypothetical protein
LRVSAQAHLAQDVLSTLGHALDDGVLYLDQPLASEMETFGTRVTGI